MLIGALITAAVLRGWSLGEPDVWLDEAVSAAFATADPSELVTMLRLDSGPPLYYLMLGAWTAVFGDGPVALRALSATLGTATVAALYWLARRHLGTGGAGIAAWLFALWPAAVFYGRQARAYALLTLLATLGVLALDHWRTERRTADLVAFAVLVAAALYTHHYGLLLAGALALSLLPSLGRRRGRYAAAALGVAGLLYLPWTPILRAQLANTAPTAWMSAVWESYGPFGSLVASVRSMTPGGAQAAYVPLPRLPWIEWLAATATILAATWGAVTWARRRTRDGAGLPTAFPFWLAGPPLLAVAVSVARTPIYLPGRLDQVVLPAWLLLTAAGLAAIRKGPWRVVAVGSLLVAATIGVGAYLTGLSPAGDRAVAERLAATLRAGDAVVATGLARAPIEYHLRGRVADVRWHSFPLAAAAHPGNDASTRYAADRAVLEREAASLVDTLRAQPGWSGRVALILQPTPVTDTLVQQLLAEPSATEQRALGRFEQTRLGIPTDVFLLDFRAGRSR